MDYDDDCFWRGGAADLMEGPVGYDLSHSLWRNDGWREMAQLRRKLENLKELRDLVRALGRASGKGPRRRAPQEVGRKSPGGPEKPALPLPLLMPVPMPKEKHVELARVPLQWGCAAAKSRADLGITCENLASEGFRMVTCRYRSAKTLGCPCSCKYQGLARDYHELTPPTKCSAELALQEVLM